MQILDKSQQLSQVRKKNIGLSIKAKGKVSKRKKTWLERTQGIAKEAWKGIDTTKYLDDLRNEWDRRS